MIGEAGRAFACPSAGTDGVVDAVAEVFAREVTEQFLERHHEEVDGCAPQLRADTGAWLDGPMSFEGAWAPVFGTLRERLVGVGEVGVDEAALRLGLHLVETGAPAKWHLDLNRPAAARFAEWQFPDATRVKVESDGRTAHFDVMTQSGARKLTCERSDNGWRSDSEASYVSLDCRGQRVAVALAETLLEPELAYLRPEALTAGDLSHVNALWEQTMDLLETYSDGYLAWVRRLLRVVVPLRADEPDSIRSGSDSAHPGLSHLSFRCSPVALAEMLVHEVTHHYYYLATRTGPVVVATHDREYYSPVKERPRPLYYILIAYHAFANVQLFFESITERGYADDDGYVAGNNERVGNWNAQLEEHMRGNPAMTELGNALWEPLSQRLA